MTRDAPIFMKKQKHIHALRPSAFRLELFEQLWQCLRSAFVKRNALACELCFTWRTKEVSLIRKMKHSKLAMVLFIRPLGKEKAKRKRKLEGKMKKKRNASKACNKSRVWCRKFSIIVIKIIKSKGKTNKKFSN